jgi:hypothetical protein
MSSEELPQVQEKRTRKVAAIRAAGFSNLPDEELQAIAEENSISLPERCTRYYLLHYIVHSKAKLPGTNHHYHQPPLSRTHTIVYTHSYSLLNLFCYG